MTHNNALTITHHSATSRDLAIPANLRLVSPRNYMLFLLDDTGTPTCPDRCA